MVEAAARACQARPWLPPTPTSTGDALVALATAFTFGSILLALFALVGVLAWGIMVKVWAEREARAEAKNVAKACAYDYIRVWIANEAPKIIRERVDIIAGAALGSGDAAKTADTIGKEA